MQTKDIPGFKPKLSRIAFGGAALSGNAGGYGFGEIGETNAENLVRTALEAGINIFDTAPIYGFNTSEIRLGKFLKTKRDEITLVSKAGITWHSSKRVNLTNEPKVVESMLHASLKHLQTDYIDVYMIHWPDPRVDIRFPLEVLQKAKEAKKILHIGLCNTNLEDYLKTKEVGEVRVLQSECNLFHNPLSEFSEWIKKDKLITMGWGTLDKGILAGTVKKDSKFSKEDARSWAPWWKQSNWEEKVAKASLLKKKFGAEPIELALNYTLNQVDFALCGFKNENQLEKLLNIQPIDLEILEKASQYVRN